MRLKGDAKSESHMTDTQNPFTERFVILFHSVTDEFAKTSGRDSHWDLMLESDGVLKTWALDLNLIERIQQNEKLVFEFKAYQLPDHRIDYLTYEGPISGCRGNVLRLESGDINWKQKESNQVSVELDSKQVKGTLSLSRSSDDEWLLRFTKLSGNED